MTGNLTVLADPWAGGIKGIFARTSDLLTEDKPTCGLVMKNLCLMIWTSSRNDHFGRKAAFTAHEKLVLRALPDLTDQVLAIT